MLIKVILNKPNNTINNSSLIIYICNYVSCNAIYISACHDRIDAMISIRLIISKILSLLT